MNSLATSERRRLVAAASAAARRSHRLGHPSPRGAALLFREGRIVAAPELSDEGVGTGSCAERVALYRALLERKERPRLILIRGGERGDRDGGPPCGACLQVLLELAATARIYWGTTRAPLGGHSPRRMLPGAFDAASFVRAPSPRRAR